MVGPAFAALLLAAGQNEGVCFLLNGVSYLVMIFAVVAIGVTNDVTTRNRSPHLLEEMKEGLLFAWNQQTIRYLLLFLSTISFWGVSYVVLMPIFSADVLGSGPEGLGILMSASGLGSVVGALLVAARASRGGPDNVRGVATGCGVGLGFALVGFAASHHLWLSALFSAVLGGLLMTLAATANAYIQLLIPDDLRGRVMSLYITSFVGSVSFGHFFAGLVAGQTGAATAVVLAGIAALGITVMLSRKLPVCPPSAEKPTADPAWL
jgi:MFS family permease